MTAAAADTRSLHRIGGFVQTYDWGSTNGLAAWQSDAPIDKPQAELWFGDHPAGPSPLIDRPGSTLADVRNSRSPMLLKILAAARPLSLQVHPDDDTASGGMPDFVTSVGSQVLVDSSGKDEMVLAVSEFRLLAGFRPTLVATPMLRALGGPMTAVAETYRLRGASAAATQVFTLGAAEVAAVIARIDEVLGATGHHPATRESMHDLAEKYPSDPAVLVAFMLQHRVLAPGEALHVSPGTPHAYLRGTAVELMTNSDNVLRLGFTTKPLAIDAALSILRTQPAEIIVGAGPSHDAVYYAGGAPFLMRKVTRAVELLESPHRVVLCLEGSAVVAVNNSTVELPKGVALTGDDWSAGHIEVRPKSVVVIAELA